MFSSLRSLGSPLRHVCLLSTQAPSKPRRGLKVAAASIAFVAAAGALAYSFADEGLRRTMYFWYKVGPIYTHYRLVERLVKGKPEPERAAAFDALHRKYASSANDIILGLRGFYIKLGQMGSAMADFVPQVYIDELELLQDQVPAESFAYVKEVMERALQRPLSEVFAHVEEQPIGSASIGQVHRARLLDGREVVIKVKYPFVERVFDSDMETTENFCRLVQPEQVPFLKEIRRQFMKEFDYEYEALSLATIAANIEPKFREVRIPHPITPLCSRDLLVMEYLPGEKLLVALKRHFLSLARASGLDISTLKLEMLKAPDARSWGTWAYIKYLQTATTLKNAGVALYNYSVGLAFGQKTYYPVDKFVDIAHIMDVLLRVHGHEVLVDGMFNGDPHPGNVLLMPDGRLGLIDYGQVKALSHHNRILFAKMIVALAAAKTDDIREIYHQMGHRTARNDPVIMQKMATIAFDRHNDDFCDGMNLQQYLEWLNVMDPVVHAADEFVMASRLSILLRGLGSHLGYPVSTAVAWLPIAKRVLREAGDVEPL